jgi:hypothetical protein
MMQIARMKAFWVALSCSLLGLGCTPSPYVLVPAGPTRIAVSRLHVNPGIAWNRVPSGKHQKRWETVWTQNGPLLDTVSLIGGLPDGKALFYSDDDDAVQVPEFRAGMSPSDLVSMIQARYQAYGIASLDLDPMTPAQFLGGTGTRFGFRYRPDGGAARKGVCLVRVVDDRLYALTLDAEATHYFGVLLPEFEKLVASATLK